MNGVVLTPEFAAQVTDVVRRVLRQEQGTLFSSRHQGRGGEQSFWAITNAAIAAPSNGVTTPTTGAIEFLQVDSNGNLARTGDTDTLTHRWEGIDLVKDTLIRVITEGDEVILVGADCEALGSPPS